LIPTSTSNPFKVNTMEIAGALALYAVGSGCVGAGVHAITKRKERNDAELNGSGVRHDGVNHYVRLGGKKVLVEIRGGSPSRRSRMAGSRRS